MVVEQLDNQPSWLSSCSTTIMVVKQVEQLDNHVSSSNGSCLPQIRNTTLPPEKKFDYFNVSKLYLLSNCTKNLSEDLSRYKVKCVDESRDSWVAVFEWDENLKNALENCEEIVVAPVEVLGDEGRNETGNYMEILRRGFVLNWTAIDCSICAESGGRCGFNESILHFKSFCPDRPHSSSCKPALGTHYCSTLIARTDFMNYMMDVHTCGEAMVKSETEVFYPDELSEFFKVYMSALWSERMRIPPAFIENFGGKIPRKVMLGTPSNLSWQVRINKINDDLFFEGGWPEFMQENSLAHGEFLTFCYADNSKFYVKIFSTNGCRKRVATRSMIKKEPVKLLQGNETSRPGKFLYNTYWLVS
ncbi:LEAF RUST 10 DISEASE-RESISTANCE LOCUS RECEPTOR-LIKE PROTEIN KINASE-like 2.1 [Forsythia ovata]|uniref:LEAF RUST 10 DISEASE-RESISTANCE LOCUS RECEPTOR-LIKE PROTEIN KINASE-like 2.1 n=1 Tax=Forsythia ovata TaxID=205694 RepID=A0ABD1VM08_9LAMI